MRIGLSPLFKSMFSWFLVQRYAFSRLVHGYDVANYSLKAMDKVTLQSILRMYGAKIGENCDIQMGITFHNCRNFSKLVIGDNCHIGKDCFLDLSGKVAIGDNTTISMRTMIITHIDVGNSGLKSLYDSRIGDVTIENDCYIGASVSILMGVTISQRSFVAASSLVNKDIPADSFVAGTPAMVIKSLCK